MASITIPPAVYRSIVDAAPAERANVVRNALEAGKLDAKQASDIASVFRFPNWEQFKYKATGTTPYATNQHTNVTKAKPLPASSPLFAQHTKFAIAQPVAGSPAKAKDGTWRDVDLEVNSSVSTDDEAGQPEFLKKLTKLKPV